MYTDADTTCGGLSGLARAADVGRQQADNLDGLACLSERFSAMVTAGRTQAAFFSQWGRSRGSAKINAPQEGWRRGCRRADVFCWRWLLPQRWLPAPKRPKKPSWLNRSRLSRPTPANTNNTSGRAGRHWWTLPAPNFGLLRHAVVARRDLISRLTLAYPLAGGQSGAIGVWENF